MNFKYYYYLLISYQWIEITFYVIVHNTILLRKTFRTFVQIRSKRLFIVAIALSLISHKFIWMKRLHQINKSYKTYFVIIVLEITIYILYIFKYKPNQKIEYNIFSNKLLLDSFI